VKDNYEVKRKDGEEMLAYCNRIDQLAPVNAARAALHLVSPDS